MSKIRNTLYVLGVLLLSTTAFAQPTEVGDFLGFESFQRFYSAGLFDNALGAASSVIEDGSNIGFSDLNSNYLFAGLGNLNAAQATATLDEAANFDLDTPLLFGMYRNAATPWSLFSGVHVEGNRVRNVAVAETVEQDTTVTDGDTDTDYEWISQRVTTDTITREDYRIANQFITQLAGMNTGLYLDLAVTGGDKTTTVTENYFDETNATTIPDPQRATTQTTVATNGGVLFVGLGLPVFLEADGLGHYLNPQVVYRRDATASTTGTTEWETFDLEAGTVGVNTVDDSTKDVTTDLELVLDYAAIMPAMFGEHDRNRLRLDAMAGVALEARSAAVDDRTTIRTFDGTTVTDGNTETITSTTDYQGAWDFGGMVGASHSFYHDVGAGVEFAFEPGVTVGLSTTPTGGPRLVRFEEDDQTVDNNGDNVTRTQTTQEIEYAARNRTTILQNSLSLPVALRAHPEDWVFGFTISGTPSVVHTMTSTTTYSDQRASQTDTTVTTTGADPSVTNTTVTEVTERERARNTVHTWGFEVEHRLGINVPLSEQASLDIGLGGTLLDLNNFFIQAVVAY